MPLTLLSCGEIDYVSEFEAGLAKEEEQEVTVGGSDGSDLEE